MQSSLRPLRHAFNGPWRPSIPFPRDYSPLYNPRYASTRLPSSKKPAASPKSAASTPQSAIRKPVTAPTARASRAKIDREVKRPNPRPWIDGQPVEQASPAEAKPTVDGQTADTSTAQAGTTHVNKISDTTATAPGVTAGRASTASTPAQGVTAAAVGKAAVPHGPGPRISSDNGTRVGDDVVEGTKEKAKRYKSAERRILAIICGLPIVIVTSYFLWQRLVSGKQEQKRLILRGANEDD